MKRDKCHALNGHYRADRSDPDWSLCGLMPHQIREIAGHYGPFGVTCKTCIRMMKRLEAADEDGGAR